MFVERMDQLFYPHSGDDWDSSLFRERILSCVSQETIVLDLGAGAGRVTQMNFKGMAARVHGIDPDWTIANNPHLDVVVIGSGAALPYREGTFDIVIACNVLEHLEAPGLVFKEVYRVLKRGGRYFIKTPNKFHYVPMVARLTPHRFHRWFNELRGRAANDTYPTWYRANTRRTVERLATAAGFEIESIEEIEGRPEYLRMMPLTYLFGLLYERMVNSASVLSAFRVLLLAELVKPGSEARLRAGGVLSTEEDGMRS